MDTSVLKKFSLISVLLVLAAFQTVAADTATPNITSQDLLDADEDSIILEGEKLTVLVNATDNNTIASATANVTPVDSSSFDLVNETASGLDWNGDGNLNSTVYGANLTITNSEITDGFSQLNLSVKFTDNATTPNTNSSNYSETFVIDTGNFASGGSGTEGDPYQISQISHFSSLEANPEAFYEITSDIDASNTRNIYDGKGFKAAKHFNGTLDGNNHTLSNLFIDRTGYEGFGLFKSLNGTVENLELRNFSIDGGHYTGSLAGTVRNSTLRNINYTVSVNGTSNAGGLIGQVKTANATTRLENINGDVNISESDSTGGIIGIATRYESGSIKTSNFDIDGTIDGSANTGGIIGFAGEVNLTFSNGHVSGDISSPDWAGGLVGVVQQRVDNAGSDAQGVEISGVKSLANLDGSAGAGGLIGHTEVFTEIDDSSFDGNIKGGFAGGALGQQIEAYQVNDAIDGFEANNFSVNGKVETSGSNPIGGLSGQVVDVESSIHNIVNNATINDSVSGESESGGILGRASGTMDLVNVTNYANIYSEGRRGGGIIGGLYTGANITNAVNHGNLDINGVNSGNTYAGGITGFSAGGPTIIQNTDNYGDISGRAAKVGGISGSLFGSQSYNLTNVSNYGKISSETTSSSGESYTGGLAGITSSDMKMENIHNYGLIDADGTEIGGLVGGMFYGSHFLKNATNNASISAGAYSSDYKSHAAGLVGLVSDDITLVNATNYANISGEGSHVAGITGGIIGKANLSNVENYGNISAGEGVYSSFDGDYNVSFASGIIAYTIDTATIEDVENHGDVSGTAAHVSGIIPMAIDKAEIANTTNYGSISAGRSGEYNSSFASGIISDAISGAEIIDTENYGTISGSASYTSGIIAMTIGDLNVTDTSNYGDIFGGGTKESHDRNLSYSAGIVAQVIGNTKIENVHNNANITAPRSRVGGIVAQTISDLTVANSSHEGNISATSGAGGIIGGSFSSAPDVDSVTANGSIETGKDLYDFSSSGGLTGFVIGLNINDSENYMTVDAEGSRIGGITGASFSNSVFQNVTNHRNITGMDDQTGRSHIGGIIGIGSSDINISNSWNNGTLEGDGSRVGGISGGLYTNIYLMNVTNYRDIKTEKNSPYSYAGGLVGMVSGFEGLNDSSNHGDVYAEGDIVGGLFGASHGEYDTVGNYINNSGSFGEVSGDNSVGGISGISTYVDIQDSNSSGKVRGINKVGGIVGEIYNRPLNRLNSNATVTGYVDVGGIVGLTDRNITSSYSSGDVTGIEDVGGLVGTYLGGTVSNTYARGDILGKENIGGLIGDSAGLITESFAVGTVQATSGSGLGTAGGLVARSNGTVEKSYARGNVYGGMPGGLVGELRGDISNSYSTGQPVLGSTGDIYSGGLVAVKYSGIVVDSYWDIESSGTSSSRSAATGLQTPDMKTESGLGGFDFGSTWSFRNNKNNGYPVLDIFYENEFLNNSGVKIVTPSDIVEITFDPGRNFVSFPVSNGATYDLDNVLGSYSPMIKSVWTYNGSWQSSKPWDSSFSSDFTEIRGGEGYLVYSNSSGSFTVNFEPDKNSSDQPSGVTVEKDRWNLIGSYSQRPVENFGPLFGSASESGITLKRYTGAGFSDAERISPGEAFWVVPRADTLYRPN